MRTLETGLRLLVEDSPLGRELRSSNPISLIEQSTEEARRRLYRQAKADMERFASLSDINLDQLECHNVEMTNKSIIKVLLAIDQN
ncbi:hypothetical protein P7B04_14250 [Sphingobium yanoikuyae]|jgi:hypothetical protein|uniref:hypothetical protein n=1 Tax=Sphingobium yanoikuyae TaxID=13690 RepID=UPI00117A5BE4|nr:hypothetical protein [Sphingobium yanoikuyae]MDG2513857.1 hypothetical protein [Sphingobium yanoikuyae]